MFNPTKCSNDKLLLQRVENELVFYDLQRNKCHGLNPTAAFVWEHCDGHTSPAELATLVSAKVNVPQDTAQKLTWLALDQLEKAHLLQEKLSRPEDLVNRYSRRKVLKQVTLLGFSMALLPLVTTIAAPSESDAASPKPSPRCKEGETKEVYPVHGGPKLCVKCVNGRWQKIMCK